MLTCRNPFKADEVLIDYDMDSEDEWAEENGEEINDDNQKSDDDEEDAPAAPPMLSRLDLLSSTITSPPVVASLSGRKHAARKINSYGNHL